MCGEYAYEWGTFYQRVRPAGAAETASRLHGLRILKRQPSCAWKVYRATWNDAPAGESAAAR